MCNRFPALFSLLLVLFTTKDVLSLMSSPIGHWTFENGDLTDMAGNFGDIILVGAVLDNGQLDVSLNKWAHTNGSYHGPSISEKTMISWASIDSFSVQRGSIFTIDKILSDQFDAIVFGEIKSSYWMAGSSYGQRTIDPKPGYKETKLNSMVQMAISYEKKAGNQAHMRLYRNGELIGDYTKGTIAVWNSADTEAIWGTRHFLNGKFYDSLDMHIEESRLYGEVLTSEEIRKIYPTADEVLCSVDQEGDIKLDTSTTPPLVMMCSQGKWGYICGSDENPGSDRPWTIENVGVACQQLGYIREDSYTAVPELDDQVSVIYPVSYHYLYCTGTEKRLIDCAHGDTDVHHGHCKVGSVFKYGAATCTTTPIKCQAGEIKLVDNVLKVCSQGDWYSVCGDENTWTTAHAKITCKQLGMNPNGSNASSVPIPDGEGDYTLDMSFNCIGSELSLQECSTSSTIMECANMAGVTCGEVEVIPSSSSSSVGLSTTTSSMTTSTMVPSMTPSSCPTVTVTVEQKTTVPVQATTSTRGAPAQPTDAAPSCTSSPDSERSTSGLFQGTDSTVGFIVGAVVGLVVTALLYTLILVSVVAWARRSRTKETAQIRAHSSVSNPVFGGAGEDKEPIYDED